MMRKTVNFLAAFAVIFVLSACTQPPSGDGAKIVVIDPGKIFRECTVGMEASKYFKDVNEKFQAEAQSLQEEMQKNKNEENTQKFQKAVADYQARIGAEQTRIATLLDEKFKKVLNEYRAKNNVGVILNKGDVLSFDARADVTDAIVKAMNDQHIDLFPPKEPAAEPADEEKTEKTGH
ncbi:MAG: OmpH family outer membrane protein [Thermodesulfobacteriota bacterium]|nr:OmpH family outer membrane protein [Thermodesulfobacteriota bacterium]